MSRNVTPRPVRAQGARDSHGRILGKGAGALYVHLHREAGLAHRHYVLRPWQVRLLAFVTSWPMLILYLVSIASWGWLASQAARVPILELQVTSLTADAMRLDTLTATLTELQERYDHVQRLLGTASSGSTRAPSQQQAATSASGPATTPPRVATTPDTAGVRRGGSAAVPSTAADSAARRKAAADSAAKVKAAADSAAKVKAVADSAARKALSDTTSGATLIRSHE